MTQLSFTDAMAACPGLFGPAATAWPETLSAQQLACIQRPNPARDQAVSRRQQSLLASIQQAMDSGALARVQVEVMQSKQTASSANAIAAWKGYQRTGDEPFGYAFGPGKECPKASYEQTSTQVWQVTGAAFVAWLQAEGETPSVHVQKWCEAFPQVVASVFPLADFAALVAYRKGKKGASWAVGNQIAIAKQEVAAMGGTAKAKESVAEALGTTRQALHGALNRERKRDRKGKGADASANGLADVVKKLGAR